MEDERSARQVGRADGGEKTPCKGADSRPRMTSFDDRGGGSHCRSCRGEGITVGGGRGPGLRPPILIHLAYGQTRELWLTLT